MSQVLILTDTVTQGDMGDARYLGPYVCATFLEAEGFDTQVIDFFTRHPDFFKYLENFLSPDLLMVAISTTFLFGQYNGGRYAGRHTIIDGCFWLDSPEEMADWMNHLRALIDKYNPNCKIVFGGWRANEVFTWNKHDSQPFRHADYAIFRAGELKLTQLAQSLKEGAPLPGKTLLGVRALNGLNTQAQYSCPQTRFLPKHGIQPSEGLPIEISRGCVFNCKFCYFDKRKSFLKDTDLLYEELLRNYELFGTQAYQFCDDCFNDSRKKVESVCNTIKKLPFDIEWVSYARVDLAVKFPETFDAMIESGGRGFFFGIESFDPKAARVAGKGTHPDKVKDWLLTIRNKYSDKCLIKASFIVGLPGETKEQILDTMDWVLEHQPFDFLSVGALHIGNASDNPFSDDPEFAKNPEKYGFTKMDSTKRGWEHEHMNYQSASELATHFHDSWRATGKNTFNTNLFSYTTLKSMNYSWDEICSMSRDESKYHFWRNDFLPKYQNYLNKYWNDLSSGNTRIRTESFSEARI